MESEQYLRWGIPSTIGSAIYQAITDVYKYFGLLLVKYALRHIQLQPSTAIMRGSRICLHKGMMALKGLLNSIVHSNSNKAVFVHNWPLTRCTYILTYPDGLGNRFGVYVYIPNEEIIKLSIQTLTTWFTLMQITPVFY